MARQSAFLPGAPRTTLPRVLFGVGVVTAWSALQIAWASATTETWMMVVAGVLLTVPLVSMWEWMVHGVLYHGGLPGLDRVRAIHVTGHHGVIFPPKRYVQDGPFAFMRFRTPRQPWRMADNKVDELLTSWSQVALHFIVGVPTFVIPAWLLSDSLPFAISVTATLAFLSWLLAYVHGCIHTPRDRMIESMRWFQWLDRHHYIHHIDGRANINFLLPLCDVLFGTFKPALTEREAAANPSFEEAKPMAKDIGRGKRKLAA